MQYELSCTLDSLSKWDKYYLDVCNTIAENSKCLSKKIGAILVDDKSIVATGYNGPPRNVPHCSIRHKMGDNYLQKKLIEKNIRTDKPLTKCPRYILGYKSGEGLDICIAGHAERNALINAGRTGVKTKGLKMYMNCPVPCTPCLIEIINAGIEEIIVTSLDFYDGESEFLINYIKHRTYAL